MLLKNLCLVVLSITLTACNISGSAQKGPYKSGSSITASKLNAQGAPIASDTIITQVKNSHGRFSVDRIKWSGWTGLVVSGQYFDEFSNADSNADITLNAITKKDRKFDTANINLYTHLAAARIQQRIANGQNRNNAWRDTQTEMKQVFDLKQISTNFHRGVEQLDLLRGTGSFRKDNANLLLFTGAFLSLRDSQNNLQLLSQDFADDGQFNAAGLAAFSAIAAQANTDGFLANLSQNLQSIGINNPPNQNDLKQLPSWVDADGGSQDNIPPIITITGDSTINLFVGDEYEDAGATAIDNVDGEIDVETTGNNVDTNLIGEYQVTYSATDAAGNDATSIRNIIVSAVADSSPPVISINGDNPLQLTVGDEYVETGATAIDDVDEVVVVNISGEVNTALQGTYIITYTASDSAGNNAEDTRDVIVSAPSDATAPVISIDGDNPAEVFIDSEYVDAGATATDNVDESVTVNVNSNVDTSNVGTYQVVYTASDAAGNAAEAATRQVIVIDNIDPVITITGDNPLTQDVGEEFNDEGATAFDNVDGTIDVEVITNNINTSEVGNYQLVYKATDEAGNSSEKTREVIIEDNVSPEIDLNGASPINLFVGDNYVDEGATAVDNVDGEIEVSIIRFTVDTDTAGTYEVVYSATDDAGNSSELTRTVIVSELPIQFSTINVRITSPEGEILNGVIVVAIAEDGTQSSFITSREGIAEISLKANQEFVLKFDGDGLATQVLQVKTPLVDELINLDVTMIARGEIKTFIAEDGATLVGNNGASVEIGPNSFATLSSGVIVSGEIQVTITPVDVSNSSLLDAFPGEFVGIQTDTTETPIISYGTVEYKFTQDGQELQLVEGTAAVIQIPIYIATFQNGDDIVVGDVIPLWSLNETTGIWLQESADAMNPGFGRVIASDQSPTGLALEAIVDHFTWWNCDVSMNAGEANVSVSSGNSLFTGTAIITANVDESCNIGWRPPTVTRSVTVGGSANGLAIPSSCEVCWSAELSLSDSQVVTSNYQCDSVGPNGSVDINLSLAEEGPLGILADEEETSNKTIIIGFAAERVQLRPTTIQDTVNYSIVSGSLPPGLSLIQKNRVRAEIAGSATQSGNFTVVIQGADSAGTETDTVTVNYSVTDPSTTGIPLFVNDPINLSFNVFGGPIIDGPRDLIIVCGIEDELCGPIDQTQSYDLNFYNVGMASTNWSLEIDNDTRFPEAPPVWLLLSNDGILTIDQDTIPSGGQWNGKVNASNAAGSTSTRLVVCIGGIDSDCANNTSIPVEELELEIRFRQNSAIFEIGDDPGTFFFETFRLGIIDGVYLNDEFIAGRDSINCNQSGVDYTTPGNYNINCSFSNDEDSVSAIFQVVVVPPQAT